MGSQIRHGLRWVATGVCSLLLALLLPGCGWGSNGNTATPTSKPTTAPLTTYTGKGFTIGYPQGWKVTSSRVEVSISDGTGAYDLTIGVTSNPRGILSADRLADGSAAGARTQLKNPQTETIAPTASVGGDTWSQRAVSGTAQQGGQATLVKGVVLADNHPASSASTQAFVIAIFAFKPVFDLAWTNYFQPMLQSFKFA